jgi:DNA-binding transcriptional ArsR family regulator
MRLLLPPRPKHRLRPFAYHAAMYQPEHETDIAPVAALFGDPARARMLMALMEGLERPASELAQLAHIAPQTASAHLAKLQEGGLVTVRQRGRWRYYRLAGAEVASAIEALQNLSRGSPPQKRAQRSSEGGLEFARTCYDHLAGYVAVSLTEALLGHGHLEPHEAAYRVTASGWDALATLEIDAQSVSNGSRVLAKPCLDWTERRPHLGGALGVALTRELLGRKWVIKLPDTRAVHLTPGGLAGLERVFGVRL